MTDQATEAAPEGSATETRGFQTEVKQLLHLMIHSLYSNREIFLRELISNASDACDKLRFEAVSDANLLEDDAELGIRVDYDREAGTVSVSDNGIGMSREEIIDNIGTIASSGTRKFLESLTGDQAIVATPCSMWKAMSPFTSASGATRLSSIWFTASRSAIASASACAGNICPPVPPAAMTKCGALIPGGARRRRRATRPAGASG